MIGLTSKITHEVSFGRRNHHLNPCPQMNEWMNESINQSNFYSTNIPGKARFSGATAKSVFNSKIEETVPTRKYDKGPCLKVRWSHIFRSELI